MLLLGMLFACGQGFARGIADDSGTDPAVVIDRHIQHYVVDPSGAYLLTVDSAKTIVEARAVQEHGQYYISYNKTLDDVVALDAYTLKPDGRRVPLRPGQVKDQQEAASTDAPMFQDTRLKIVVFPEVAVGDQLVVSYAIRRATPLFPGHFEDLSFSPFYLNKNFVLIYDMPASMPLHADAVGFVLLPLSPRDVVSKGRKRYQWRYVGGDNQRLEADSVSYLDYGRRLAVSTFADYADFARAFRANNGVGADTGASTAATAATATAPAAAPAPAIATLARQLSAGLPDARARALATSATSASTSGRAAWSRIRPPPCSTTATATARTTPPCWKRCWRRSASRAPAHWSTAATPTCCRKRPRWACSTTLSPTCPASTSTSIRRRKRPWPATCRPASSASRRCCWLPAASS
jgi:hypothetical protein